MSAKLHLRFGSMNVGKSTQLLQIAYNYEEGGHQVAIFTAELDNRTTVGEVASRLGARRTAAVFNRDTDFQVLLEGREKAISCVLIDEAQFLTATQVRALHRIAATKDLPVMAFAIRTDFQGMPFEGSVHLLALAEDVQEIKAVCECGRKSTMNMRIDGEGRRVSHGAQILIGGNSRYRQVCARCFYEIP
jgi:thymidine kinase